MYQAQGWAITRLTGRRAQPNSWPANQEAEETPVSAELSGSKDGNRKLRGLIPRWPSTSTRGPVEAGHRQSCLSLPYIEDALFNSVSFQFRSSSSTLGVHLTARGWLVNTEETQGPGLSIRYLGVIWTGKTSLPPKQHPYAITDTGFRDINSGTAL